MIVKTGIPATSLHGPLNRYVKQWVAHAPGMPETFSLLPQVSDPDMHPVTCVTHVPWRMPESLTSGFLWSRWRGKRSRYFRRMRNPQFYVSGRRPMPQPPVDIINGEGVDDRLYLIDMWSKPRSYDGFEFKITVHGTERSNSPLSTIWCKI